MSIIHPYNNLNGGEWLRGNLHTHTTKSDGVFSPQQILDLYGELGYDYLMISDHDKITSDEEYQMMEAHGMVLLTGNEISRNGVHTLHVDACAEIVPDRLRQKVLNDIEDLARETGRGFAIIAHPNWQEHFNHASLEKLREWVGYKGIEIFNASCLRGHGSAYATDKWDMLLSEGRKLWGYANDDSHRREDVGAGWNMVYAYEKTVQGVSRALQEGRFYASTGVIINKIEVEGNRIRIETENAEHIAAIKDTGMPFSRSNETWIEVEVPESARYVRFQCWGQGESMAWTQPFFNEVVPDQRSTPGRPKDKDWHPYLDKWAISGLVMADSLSDASPEDAAKSKMDNQPLLGDEGKSFIDLRGVHMHKRGYVYAKATIPGATAGYALMKLGYDGPIRIWVNNREIFHGPGDNPAIKDAVRIYAELREGDNDILVAFHSNRGNAWGFWCGVEQDGRALK